MANSQVKKFCKDCKWVDKGEGNPVNWICTVDCIPVRYNLVSGKPLPNYCESVRLGDECGPAGQLWEPAEIIMD